MIDEDRSQWSLEELAAECIEACELPMGCRGTIIATLHDAKEQGRAESDAYAGNSRDALRDILELVDGLADTEDREGERPRPNIFMRIEMLCEAALAQAPEGAKNPAFTDAERQEMRDIGFTPEQAAALDSPGGGLAYDKLCEVIEEALKWHRLQHTLSDDESGGQRLVDNLSAPFDETIKTGNEEIVLLAEAIADEIQAAQCAPSGESPALPAEGEKVRFTVNLNYEGWFAGGEFWIGGGYHWLPENVTRWSRLLSGERLADPRCPVCAQPIGTNGKGLFWHECPGRTASGGSPAANTNQGD